MTRNQESGEGGVVWWVQGVGLLDRVSALFSWPLKARRSLFPDWFWMCDESSPDREGSAYSCQNFGGKTQNGAPANS